MPVMIGCALDLRRSPGSAVPNYWPAIVRFWSDFDGGVRVTLWSIAGRPLRWLR
jgi:hypothetical protein